jgi:hypothetical protein
MLQSWRVQSVKLLSIIPSASGTADLNCLRASLLEGSAHQMSSSSHVSQPQLMRNAHMLVLLSLTFAMRLLRSPITSSYNPVPKSEACELCDDPFMSCKMIHS